ncbi:AraC family transcriptional regulator [Paenibacillus terreus]|uniref:AraC family transcriptional regulator n=1 Tax=Paenibacillus terreus TaxID=1387834 RepID=A0ABV5B5G7_9BACL
MNHKQLDRHLRQFDEIEKIQVVTRRNINDLGVEMLPQPGTNVFRMKGEFFFKKNPVFISKHHRFANMPLHNHDFIEINYVYSGECRQVINGREVKLAQGQCCLLDVDVPHSIAPLEENDIIINIIMKHETVSQLFFSRLHQHGLVYDFLANAVVENRRHDRYILFHSEDNENLQYLIKNMICEFMDPREYSQDMLKHYIPLVFTELMRVYQHDKNFELEHQTRRGSIVDILEYIEAHYNDCTLTELAQRFNFNPNYLGNMIKERTGRTFLEWVQSQRMIRAGEQLRLTDKQIHEVAAEVGYEGISFFNRKFKEHYGVTPGQYRKREQP